MLTNAACGRAAGFGFPCSPHARRIVPKPNNNQHIEIGGLSNVPTRPQRADKAPDQAFFLVAWIPSPRGGGVPACLFGNSGCPQRNHPPPPPVGVGQEWVGIFWGKYL